MLEACICMQRELGYNDDALDIFALLRDVSFLGGFLSIANVKRLVHFLVKIIFFDSEI